jgi:hypothetical protein
VVKSQDLTCSADCDVFRGLRAAEKDSRSRDTGPAVARDLPLGSRLDLAERHDFVSWSFNI